MPNVFDRLGVARRQVTPEALTRAVVDALAVGTRLVLLDLPDDLAWARITDALGPRSQAPSVASIQAIQAVHPDQLDLLIAALSRVREGGTLVAHIAADADDEDTLRSLPVALAILAAEGIPMVRVELPQPPDERRLQDLLATVRALDRAAPAATRLLDLLASVGTSVPTSLALAAADASPDDLTRLADHRLVRCRGDRLGFAHPELHDELARRQPAERRHLRLEALLSLARATPTLAGLAAHLTLASAPGRALSPQRLADAAALLVSAAHTALGQRRFIEAARHLRDALATRALPPHEVQRAQLTRGIALASAAEPGPASDALRAACHGPLSDLAREAMQRAARELLVAGRVDDGRALLDQALREHGESIERSPVGIAVGIGLRRLVHAIGGGFAPGTRDTSAHHHRVELHYSGMIGLALIDGLRALAFQSRHLVSAAASKDPALILRALASERVYLASFNSLTRSRLPRLDRAIADGLRSLPDSSTRRTLLGQDALSRGQAAFMLGDFRNALTCLRDAEWHLALEASDVGAELLHLHAFRLWTHIWTGNLAAIVDERARLEPDSARLGRYAIANALAVEGGVLLALAKDDPAIAREAIERQFATPSHHALMVATFNAWAAKVQLALYAGTPTEAATLVDSMWSRLRSEGFMVVQLVRIEAFLLRGRAYLAAGRFEETRKAARALDREGTVLARACAAFLEAALTRRQRPAEARPLLERAKTLARAAQIGHFEMAIASALGASPGLPCGTPLTAPERFIGMLWGDPPQPA